MRALITGGAGFVGSHLAEALVEAGHTVTVIDDLSTGRRENLTALSGRSGFTFVQDTITNAAALEPLVAESDVVFHLAAAVGVELVVRSPLRVIETNVLGTHAVFEAAARHGVKVLLASSSEVYGKSENVPFHEDGDRVLGPTTRSRWAYSDSKAIDEFLALGYAQERELPVVIFRLFNTVGPRQSGRYGMVIPRLVGQALRGEAMTVYGDGRQTRCFCHVRDAVRAIGLLAANPAVVGQVYNVGSQEEVTILALAERIRALTGSRSEIVMVPYDRAYGAGYEDMRRRVPDTRRIREAVGWQPELELDDILHDVINAASPSTSPNP
jgi:UDP-glucose 4-epimerase